MVAFSIIDGWIKDRNNFLNRALPFEGRNSMTILGVHMLIIPIEKMLLDRIHINGIVYYSILLFFVVVISNLAVWLFNRYVPFLVNHSKNQNK